ncbi:MAG TPA: hypothetical protein VLJ68_11925 [Chitinophagaceae bacterium]|nr:hypothetical protein [Chitinophagaceae bacterium]
MNYNLVIIFSLSVSIAAIIGVIRFNKINSTYYPFLFFIWIGLLNEILSFAITQKGGYTGVNNNIYVLIESLLIAWQFRNWGLFLERSSLFTGIVILFLVAWPVEAFLIGGITKTISYFRLIYSFVIVLMSISIINQQLILERKSILKNPIFLICMAFIIYFTYKVIVGAFWLYGLNMSQQFMLNIFTILACINLFANLVYALAVLWIPTKHRFSLPS